MISWSRDLIPLGSPFIHPISFPIVLFFYDQSVMKPGLGVERSRAGSMARELKNMASMLPRGGMPSIASAGGAGEEGGGDLDHPADHGRYVGLTTPLSFSSVLSHSMPNPFFVTFS